MKSKINFVYIPLFGVLWVLVKALLDTPLQYNSGLFLVVQILSVVILITFLI